MRDQMTPLAMCGQERLFPWGHGCCLLSFICTVFPYQHTHTHTRTHTDPRPPPTPPHTHTHAQPLSHSLVSLSAVTSLFPNSPPPLLFLLSLPAFTFFTRLRKSVLHH